MPQRKEKELPPPPDDEETTYEMAWRVLKKDKNWKYMVGIAIGWFLHAWIF